MYKPMSKKVFWGSRRNPLCVVSLAAVCFAFVLQNAIQAEGSQVLKSPPGGGTNFPVIAAALPWSLFGYADLTSTFKFRGALVSYWRDTRIEAFSETSGSSTNWFLRAKSPWSDFSNEKVSISSNPQTGPATVEYSQFTSSFWIPDLIIKHRAGKINHGGEQLLFVQYVRPSSGCDAATLEFFTTKDLELPIKFKIDLDKFPFDTQTLNMTIVPQYPLSNYMRVVNTTSYPKLECSNLVPKFLSEAFYSQQLQSLSLPEFKPLTRSSWEWQQTFRMEGDVPVSETGFHISFRRYSEYYVTTYIGTLTVFIFVSWASFWIKVNHWPVRLTSNVVVILTVTVLRTNMSSKLPPMENLTFLELFFVGAQICFCFQIALHVMIGHLYSKTSKADTPPDIRARAVFIQRRTRYFVPLAFSSVEIFMALYRFSGKVGAAMWLLWTQLAILLCFFVWYRVELKNDSLTQAFKGAGVELVNLSKEGTRKLVKKTKKSDTCESQSHNESYMTPDDMGASGSDAGGF